ncbi:hypothetical protein JDV02_000963 [Purpureocillium takamizusanense]|uniref:NADH dehydrogenase [ubiquinone] 1 alpha subcomplex subunit n=1 Tax=Purpureocillium takamizusanense TaxID=2060973 RepID=A0A9Q8Q865_9HYPO|nr:uncharacterized protein JDV02_000963 [Purpureocillium takamizusanense]UNI14324.1 hypothetical protein JDV02_000963 [Purpureocillium takamizusanense]
MKRIGPVAQAWYKWKALRLPWRKRFFVGYDLQGNTFWEFRLTTRGGGDTSGRDSTAAGAASSERWRRIVHYPRSTHYSDVKVSPLWHQWLRHTRPDAPSLAEQRGDVARQERVKRLAAEADARWDAKPRVMESPEDVAARAALLDPQGSAPAAAAAVAAAEGEVPSDEQRQQQQQQQQQTARSGGHAPEHDPWAKGRAQGPGEKWQPAAWAPTAARKR